MSTVNKTENQATSKSENFFTTNPLKDNKEKIAELQRKSEMAKSIYEQAKNRVAILTSKRNNLRSMSIWNYNLGNQVDTSKLDKMELQLNDSKASLLSADFADTRARSTLFSALT